MNSLFLSEAARSEVRCCKYKYNFSVSRKFKKIVPLLDLEKATLHQYGTAECRDYLRLRHKKTGKSCDSYNFF